MNERAPMIEVRDLHKTFGDNAVLKMANAARNIEEGRTLPIEVICRKAG